jgi:Flp pilus assembly protein TadG
MRLRIPERGEREQGTIAIMVGMLAVVICGMAALAVDLTTQVKEHQQMYDTIDAAAHAGAYRLPGAGATAVQDAKDIAFANDPAMTGALTPTPTLYCVVASASGSVDNTQIPATCNPLSARGGSSPNYTWAGSRCNTKICSIPCTTAASDVCNTVNVKGSKPVPFAFAPIFNVSQGGTGSISSAACKGPCGTGPPNPMDVAVVADRTVSMSTTDVTSMITGIKSMLQVMTPSQQYVALGTIGRSKLNPATTTCTGSPLGSNNKARSQQATPNDSDPNNNIPATDHETIANGGGPWMPEAFSNNYLNPNTTTINTSSTLVNAIECLRNQNSYTHLASPMKAAARLLMGYSTAPETLNNADTLLPARPDTPVAQKVLIFETDGQPYESGPTGGTTTLTDANDIYSNYMSTCRGDLCQPVQGLSTRYYFNGGHEACKNLVNQAKAAKDAGILVITIAYNLGGENCDSSDHTYRNPSNYPNQDGTTPARAYEHSRLATPSLVPDILASSASEKSPGVPSVANNSCGTATLRNTENTDDDFFFCAATGDDMRTIYKTAIGQAVNGIRLVQMP